MPRALSLLVIAAGVLNLAFAILHVGFWRLFRWDDELPRLGVVNRGIVQVLNLCLTFLLALLGGALLLFQNDFVATELGRFVLLGLGAFWLVRAIYQPMFFSLRHTLSMTLFAIFLIGAAIHALAWYVARG